MPSGDNTSPVVNDGTVATEVAAWLHRQNADDLAQEFDAQGYTELADVTPNAIDAIVEKQRPGKPGDAARLKRA